MRAQRWMWIAWPAFLVAGLLEVLVFGLVDPQDLEWFGHPLALSRQAVYTLSFFAFWVLTMVSSGLTTLLAMSPFEVNRCPVPNDERPSDCARQGQGARPASRSLSRIWCLMQTKACRSRYNGKFPAHGDPNIGL